MNSILQVSLVGTKREQRNNKKITSNICSIFCTYTVAVEEKVCVTSIVIKLYLHNETDKRMMHFLSQKGRPGGYHDILNLKHMPYY
jgi:hypothetical protein